MTTFFSNLIAPPSSSPSSSPPIDNNPGSSERPQGLFKSMPPPSLPLSPLSPSSYFAIPAGLSPAELLDSPVLLNSSNILPSPTTGGFAVQGFNWNSNSGEIQQDNHIKQEDKSFSSFFQTQSRPPIPSQVQTAWSFQEAIKQESFSSGVSVVKTENSSSMQSTFTPEISGVQSNNKGGLQSDYNQPQAHLTLSKRSDDGYNWRKYGQKQVKGSENPRSYYKCTYPNCPTKKKVERSLLDGQITEIVYKGTHNHPKPQFCRRNSSFAPSLAIPPSNHDIQDQSHAIHGSGQMDSVATPENSSISMADDDFGHSSQKRKSGDDECNEDESDAKRWRIEGENEGISAAANRTVREPRVVVQTTSDIDILDDGYRWRKYGQKVVKGNPNPRSYYKCTSPGCPVRKHIERASHDLRAVITTYEGKHNHDVPAARGSGSYSAMRPLAMTQYTNNNSINNSLRSLRLEGQPPFNLDMLQSQGSFGFSGFGNPMESFMNQQSDNVFSSRDKEEPRDESFIDSLLC